MACNLKMPPREDSILNSFRIWKVDAASATPYRPHNQSAPLWGWCTHHDQSPSLRHPIEAGVGAVTLVRPKVTDEQVLLAIDAERRRTVRAVRLNRLKSQPSPRHTPTGTSTLSGRHVSKDLP